MDKEKALAEARVVMMAQFPFFSTLMYRMLHTVWDETAPTAGTDGRAIRINPQFFCSLPPKQRAFVLMHETAHAMFRHMKRGRHYEREGLGGKPFNHMLYNMAADYVINALAEESSAELLPGVLIDKQRFPATMSAEEVYKQLYEEAEQNGGSGSDGQGGSDDDQSRESGDSGNQSGQGGQGNQQAQGQFDQHDFADDNRSDVQWKQAVAEAAMVAKQRGNLPAGLQAFIGEMLEPKIDWREELRAEITARAKGEHVSWAKPNRRGKILFDAYLPSYLDMRTGVVVVEVDTSGSVSDKELQAFMSEMAAILADAPPEELWVLSVDAKVHEVRKVDDLNELEDYCRTGLKGRGGTDMTVGFDWVRQHMEHNPDFMLIMTDGYTPFGDDPGYPVIWVMSSDVTAPFGKSIHLEV